MADLTRYTIDNNGTAVTLANASTTGDAVINSTGEFILKCVNDHGTASITVNVVSQATVDALAVADAAIAVAAGATIYAGPWPRDVYNDNTGRVQITYTATAPATAFANLEIAAMVIP